MVFQDPSRQMTSPTVERELAFGLENLAVESTEIHSRVEEQIDLFRLNVYRDTPPALLSAGEQQRLAIASVLVLRPPYLILDEATSLLSGISRERVLQHVMSERTRRNLSVILVTQYPEEALLADRLIVLRNGTAVSEGSPEEVFLDSDNLQSMGVAVPAEFRLGGLL
jgi:energy-coupling factor transporter ATP-binding protein EcfA2